MLLTITTTHNPATDLGHLLHKHPNRFQSFDLSFGQAHVFYPEAKEEVCTAALLLDVDRFKKKRGHKGNFAIEQYVNDRPYVASSFTSVAIARIFGSALKGQCDARPDLVQHPIPLEAKLHAVPCKDDHELIQDLFTPLGYDVTTHPHPLDETFPEWGQSPYYTVTIKGTTRLQDLLTHLYVLIPVLDNEKHYFVNQEEIEKLHHHGQGWLNTHPKQDIIVDRYLRHQHYLKREAFGQLLEEPMALPEQTSLSEEATLEENLNLHKQRLQLVVSECEKSGAQSIVDLGCGEGRLLELLLQKPQFDNIIGIDVSHHILERAAKRLKLDQMPANRRRRIQLLQGSLVYRDARLETCDAAAIVEVIEHIELFRLPMFERVVFEFSRPKTVIITTPNSDYNVRWSSLPAGKFRHHDHRFEWTRAEFQTWATHVCEQFGYTVTYHPIGHNDSEVGAPSQMAVFTREEVQSLEDVVQGV
ncbi:MAG: 3' terminal RNA ribose 2'-O-methyltransferase Hen1 [Candidatus Latescibacteria bacterium]|jgi:3' terminal RNA ribose 2'-O-methyltransferase Hen1|nr:3' terminal RNA ribose 2'-O-methyltransferase Hen1 [Candidatus Latescibacterota bacterium]MBT5830442.1 3' terminal RNA ribose 2'-O-methyltransferase Hen1 [Candidatus Latescibacterota bacterium]